MPNRNSSPPPPKPDDDTFRSELKRQVISELVKSPIAIGVAVITALIVGFITLRLNDNPPALPPTPIPTAVSVIASPIPATATLQPTDAPTDLPTTAPQTTATVVQGLAQTANPQDYLVIEQNSECPTQRLLPETLTPVNGILDFTAVYDAFYDLIKAPEVQKPTSPLQAILTLNAKGENKNWVRLDHTAHINIRATADIPDHQNLVTVTGCGGGGDARDFTPVKLDSTFAAYQADATFADVDFFTLQPGEFEEFNIQFVCAAPGRYQIEINIPFRYVSEAGVTSNTLTALCPKSYTVWDSQDQTGVSSTSYKWDQSKYIQIK